MNARHAIQRGAGIALFAAVIAAVSSLAQPVANVSASTLSSADHQTIVSGQKCKEPNCPNTTAANLPWIGSQPTPGPVNSVLPKPPLTEKPNMQIIRGFP